MFVLHILMDSFSKIFQAGLCRFDFNIFNDQMSLYDWFVALVAGVILLELLKMFGKNMSLGCLGF